MLSLFKQAYEVFIINENEPGSCLGLRTYARAYSWSKKWNIKNVRKRIKLSPQYIIAYNLPAVLRCNILPGRSSSSNMYVIDKVTYNTTAATYAYAYA